jgi:peptide chain release factor 1
VSNPAQLRKLSVERGNLSKTVEPYYRLKKVWEDKAETKKMLEAETDPEMKSMAAEELARLELLENQLVASVLDRMLLGDEDSGRSSSIVEIRAGIGGDEAALFVADLFGMYRRYADSKGWKVEVMDISGTELGGLKEVVFAVSGEDVYRKLRYESGGHRVQRVPKTEQQGRIHTSACTIAVLPEVEDVEVDVKQEDLQIDRYHASGPGGQNVNKTSSAIRILHKPTGVVVQCQDERSQHKNLAKAMRVLRSRLYENEIEKQRQKRDAARRVMIGSGDRSERIRTYNFPQNRVTDHRINFTIYNLDRFILGDMDELIEQLMEHDRKLRLEALATGRK